MPLKLYGVLQELYVSWVSRSKSAKERKQMNAMLLKLFLKSEDLLNREEGQDLVENALILALVVVGAVAILTGLDSTIVSTLSAINSAL